MENEDEKIKKELNQYIIDNSELIDEAYFNYSMYIEQIESDCLWPKDQLAAAMMIAEQKYAHLMEYLEFELDKSGVDPFALPKATAYLIAKTDKGSIVLTYFRENNIKDFMIQLMPPDIIETMKKNSINS